MTTEVRTATPEAEDVGDLPAPATRRRRRTAMWIGCAAGVGIAGAVAAWVVLGSPWLEVRDVSVTGVADAASDQVRQAAAISTGGALALVDAAAVESRVESLPWVQNAAVVREWPHTVVITATPRQAVAFWEDAGAVKDVDGQGVAFADRPEAPPDAIKLAVAADQLVPAAAIAAALPPEVRAQVASITPAEGAQSGFALQLRDDNGTVLWGTATDNETKAAVVTVLLRQANDTRAEGSRRSVPAAWFDVSVPQAPVTAAGPPDRTAAAQAAQAAKQPQPSPSSSSAPESTETGN